MQKNKQDEIYKKAIENIVKSFDDYFDAVDVKSIWKEDKNKGLVLVEVDNIIYGVFTAKVKNNEMRFYNWEDNQVRLEKEISKIVKRLRE